MIDANGSGTVYIVLFNTDVDVSKVTHGGVGGWVGGGFFTFNNPEFALERGGFKSCSKPMYQSYMGPDVMTERLCSREAVFEQLFHFCRGGAAGGCAVIRSVQQMEPLRA